MKRVNAFDCPPLSLDGIIWEQPSKEHWERILANKTGFDWWADISPQCDGSMKCRVSEIRKILNAPRRKDTIGV